MSLLQLEHELTIWHATHFFSSRMCLLRGKKWCQKHVVYSLPNRIVPTASKLNSQMSLSRFGLILNTTLGIRIQTWGVETASKSIFQVRNKKLRLSFTGLVATFQGKTELNSNDEMRWHKWGKLQSQLCANRPKGNCMERLRAEPIKIKLHMSWEKCVPPSSGTSPFEICQ